MGRAAYRAMDVIQPWTVGRYRDQEGVDKWKTDVLTAMSRSPRRTARSTCP
jgi:hypothetical protein